VKYDYGPEWPLLSMIVRLRGRCDECGGTFAPSQLDAHHRLPRRYGGTNALANLRALCSVCHPKVEREAQLRLQAISNLLDRRVGGSRARRTSSAPGGLVEALRSATTPPRSSPPSGLAEALRRRAQGR
jgi:hypothetical protein